MDYPELVRKAFLIRQLEERLLSLHAAGEVKGTIHVCIGQEWTGVAAANAASSGDSMISNHRGHGHFLAWTGDSLGLISEVMGRATGVCGGMGGTQHLFSQGFISNGIQGGMMPVAAGWALAKKKLEDRTICIIFIGLSRRRRLAVSISGFGGSAQLPFTSGSDVLGPGPGFLV